MTWILTSGDAEMNTLATGRRRTVTSPSAAEPQPNWKIRIHRRGAVAEKEDSDLEN
jgi:hypothetical protein